ncbi:unnamed protein product [Soboliphyme baturini]|uniref:Netrin receptor UNC5A-D-like N-terminal domain-containing protein n=1 Tax=Soboliphyme baturini TaxID=241478 RepID=A0A183J1R6_9BILA|nr:unnamed protein product [Soboliphyme baturini]
MTEVKEAPTATTALVTAASGSALVVENPSPPSPVIVQPPVDTYLIRGRAQSVQLTCKALYAERIMFKCNDEWVSCIFIPDCLTEQLMEEWCVRVFHRCWPSTGGQTHAPSRVA